MDNTKEEPDDLRTRIAKGECVSPMTCDECPVCTDTCEAAHWRMELNDALKDAKIDNPKEQ